MKKPLPARKAQPAKGRNGAHKPPPGPGMKGKPDAGAPAGGKHRTKHPDKTNGRYNRKVKLPGT